MSSFLIWILGIGAIALISYWVVNRTLDIRKYQEKLSAQNLFVKTVIDSLPYPFLVIDAKTLDIVMANQAVLKKTRSTSGKCHAVHFGKNEPCGDISKCPIKLVAKQSEAVILEREEVDENGNTKFVELHAYPIFDKNGVVYQVIEFDVDITERKLTSESLIRAEKARAELEGIHKTTATYAHEINNPLTGIIGYAEMLLDPGIDAGEKERMTRQILKAAGRMTQVIEKLHEMSSPVFKDYSGGQEIIDIDK